MSYGGFCCLGLLYQKRISFFLLRVAAAQHMTLFFWASLKPYCMFAM